MSMPPGPRDALISVERLSRRFVAAGKVVDALRDVSFRVETGELIAIRGPSGSGKSTLLLILGAMLRPTSGVVRILGVELGALCPRERAELRGRRIGFVFQMFHLVPYLNVLENVLLAARGNDGVSRARELLVGLGLEARLSHKPSELSAGERQRTALARAMVHRPSLILADEPTGNLDPVNAHEVFEALDRYRQAGGTVVVVSHGAAVEPYASRVLDLVDGVLSPAAPRGGTSAVSSGT